MNREIKFRVWTGIQMEYNIMVGKFGTFYINPANNGLSETDSASLTHFNTKYSDEHPVMQFTGLLVDGHKELYEEDICRRTYRNGETIGVIKYDRQACAFHFKWMDGKIHRYEELRANFSDGEVYINDNYEILGNIFSNPELIQK